MEGMIFGWANVKKEYMTITIGRWIVIMSWTRLLKKNGYSLADLKITPGLVANNRLQNWDSVQGDFYYLIFITILNMSFLLMKKLQLIMVKWPSKSLPSCDLIQVWPGGLYSFLYITLFLVCKRGRM